MQVNIKSIKSKSAGTVNLNDDVFSVKISSGSVYHGIKNELANKRQGTAKTKGRAEVLFTNRKPWKQKGTGRARAGSRRSPIWVGGGTIFGPQPRDYSYSLPKKIKRLAFRSVLTEKLQAGLLDIIDDIVLSSPKTKDCAIILKQLNPDENRTVLIVSDNDNDLLVKRAARNIPWVRVYSFSRMLLKDLFYAKKILITKTAAENINSFLSINKEGE